MTIGQALVAAARLGLERLDAQLLLLQVLGRAPGDRAWLLAHDDGPLDAQQQRQFTILCARRAAGEPLAYIAGRREFYGLDLAVDARVLVPRPDTETLVEWALEVLASRASPRVIDLGTGSGAIALAIKHRRPDAHVVASDHSPHALEVAAANARSLGLDVEFRRGAWLAGTTDRFDLVVSNPPYVAAGDPHLAALVHEPLDALVAGPDGLDDLRAIVAQAPACLAAGGWLLLEHGHDQAAAVRGLLAAAGFEQLASRRDLAGIERCSGGRRLELG
ncbi:peptide chain release factor N(5)-glutamine methyltransferase [Ramlibacter sp.]|uniref:peptide chain release factor N(5)-glutamine methyltransferase n=1 Tax=Ramlibacter sp. TaxID=1917967 RepID=UPI002BBB3AEE|nr:peptide chain release factor N(5)-glutamine methyltransferase [Ramlibacter sp.]HWI81604.1 peptide chain release factor N(5)-glutamine methyltransferase [Ramlibacter sp.]